jgi:hypothetical protein
MGTWAAGPFGNDMAMDFVGEVFDMLMEPVDIFMESPEIDETFDEAFVAIAMLNQLMQITEARPYKPNGVDGRAIAGELMRCFDDGIDDMAPDDDFKHDHRAALVTATNTFVSLVER